MAMKLFYSPFHDFAHKVLVVSYECDLQQQVQTVASFPFRDLAGNRVQGQYELSAINPLGKVPVLVTGDGTAIYPGHLICEYLVELSGQTSLLPAGGMSRIRVLKNLMLGDALFDIAVALSMEGWRPSSERRQDLYQWLFPKLSRGWDRMETQAATWRDFDLGQIGLLQAVSYVDAWAPELDLPGNPFHHWQRKWPALAHWLQSTLKRPSVAAHYRCPYEGDTSPAAHARAVAQVCAVREAAVQ